MQSLSFRDEPFVKFEAVAARAGQEFPIVEGGRRINLRILPVNQQK
jgi:hypothetical protein